MSSFAILHKMSITDFVDTLSDMSVSITHPTPNGRLYRIQQGWSNTFWSRSTENILHL